MIFIVLVVFIIAFVMVGFLLPTKWKVERSIVVNAPVSVIYPLVANFKAGWPQWSAFDFEDPSIQYSYSGPDEGIGATRSWVSKKMGDGSQSITGADPAVGVTFQLQMTQNSFSLNGKITFEPTATGTKVTWTDFGDAGNNLMFRYMATLMDKMMGATFEKSLFVLKQKSESVTPHL